MRTSALFAVAAMLAGSALSVSSPARAQDAIEAQLVGYHQLCDKGDRAACIKFGMLIERNRMRHGDWRKRHAEWFWWDK